MKHFLSLITVPAMLLFACTENDNEATAPKAFIESVCVNGVGVANNGVVGDVDPETVSISITFSKEPTDFSLPSTFHYSRGSWTVVKGDNKYSVKILPTVGLDTYRNYSFGLVEGKAFGLNVVDKYTFSFTTAYDKSDKFTRIPDEDLLTLVQRQTFKYFWDHAHPVSGLARERLGSGETVTTGGSGFGIMCLPVAVSRGFITREQAAERMRTIVTFLAEKADRFHGAYSHWLDGTTGNVIPFSTKDNGGDLVETAFLMEGLLTARAFFDKASEADIRSTIDAIWQGVE